MQDSQDNETIDYRQCYETLRLSPPCEWHVVRLAYRRRVHECHPDLAAAGPNASFRRNDEFNDVVRAYRALAAFQRKHGRLPLARQKRLPATFRERARSRFHRQASQPRTSWKRTVPRLHQAAFALFVAGVGSAALTGSLHRADTSPAATAGGELSVGMDPNDVVSVQGVPNYTKGSVWFYGESGVIFDQGCVVGWENQPPFPLQTLVQSLYLAGQTATYRRKPDCSAIDN